MLRHSNSLLMVIRTHQSQLRLLLLCFKPMSTRKIKQNFKSNICNVALPVHLQHVWLQPQTLSVDVSITTVWWSAVRGLKFVAYCFETAFEVPRLGSFYIWLCGCLSNKEDSLKPGAHEWLAQLMILSIWPFGVTNGNMGSKIRKKKKRRRRKTSGSNCSAMSCTTTVRKIMLYCQQKLYCGTTVGAVQLKGQSTPKMCTLE